MSGKNDGGPAFPHLEKISSESHTHPSYRAETAGGMSLRDYFALNLPSDEIRDLEYRNLSPIAQEMLVGEKKPEAPKDLGGTPAHQLEMARWHAKVNAALRFIAADAMLKARGHD